MRASEQEFDRFVGASFEPVARKHRREVVRGNTSISQTAEFDTEVLRVRLNNDRGLLSVDVSPVHVSRYWPVEEIARLFPPVRLLSGGVQRLTLTEQLDLVQTHWAELESMFSGPNYKQTVQLLTQTASPGKQR